MSGASHPTTTGAIAFSDIVGFTEITADHGDEVALELIERHETIVADSLGDHGRVVKQLGDGLLLFFDDACAAVDAMLAVHKRVAQTSDDSMTEIPFWLRSGLHWGSPLARGLDLIGHDVNLASRISALAAPGELLATESILANIGAQRERFTRIGPVFVKGMSEPVRVWRALGSPAMNSALRSRS